MRRRINAKQQHFANDVKTYSILKQKISETQESLKAISLQKSIANDNFPVEFGQIIEILVAEGIGTHRSN